MAETVPIRAGDGEGATWEREWSLSLRTAGDLFRAGFITAADTPLFEALLARYQFTLPRYYASLIDPRDPECPIRRQAIPDPREELTGKGLVPDPLADLDHQPVPRITHRYKGRALLHLTPNCSMYCRFCFRKTLLNDWSDRLFQGPLAQALNYLESTPEIEEVIFSGGDPFMVSDHTLRTVVEQLAAIPHLQRLRFHTRVPVTFPARITNTLVDYIADSALHSVVVTHFNHPREVTPESAEACRRLQAKAMVLNQSVLLKGVNDRADVLVELSRALFRHGVLPYYLHHPDSAEGTEHFQVSLETGQAIYREMRTELPGYLVPRYVRDLVGAPYKVMVGEESGPLDPTVSPGVLL